MASSLQFRVLDRGHRRGGRGIVAQAGPVVVLLGLPEVVEPGTEEPCGANLQGVSRRNSGRGIAEAMLNLTMIAAMQKRVTRVMPSSTAASPGSIVGSLF